MRDIRLMGFGSISGGWMSRLFVAPETLLGYTVASVTIWGLVELVAYLARHLRWRAA